MNNLSSYCGLVDARKSASEKDLPVIITLLYAHKYDQILNNFYFSTFPVGILSVEQMATHLFNGILLTKVVGFNY